MNSGLNRVVLPQVGGPEPVSTLNDDFCAVTPCRHLREPEFDAFAETKD